MVSEDSDQFVSGLFSIHCLHDLRDVREPMMGPVDTVIDQSDAAGELFKVSPLCRMQRMSQEERNDRVDQIAPPTHHESTQMFSVVIVPPVRDHAPHSEEARKLIETPDASGALCHRKLVSHLIAGLVALAPRPRWLADETNGEATLSVYKADDPASLNQSFLLISCTRHIVTVPTT